MLTTLQAGDYLGTVVFGVTGALSARGKGMDLGGCMLLAIVTGVGGGTTRDLIISRGYVFWCQDPMYLALCILAAIGTFYRVRRISRLEPLLLWADALGLALFAVIGAAIAEVNGARPLVCVLMGVLTATGGGIIRDVLRNEIPIVLQRDIYATAALCGSLTYVLLVLAGSPREVGVVTGFMIAFALRAAAIRFDLHLPMFDSRSEVESGDSPEA